MADKITKFDSRTKANEAEAFERLGVLKTYKLFIDGKFPRTESGRYYELKDKKGKLLANVSWASRKDFRDAVTVARNAFTGWSKTTAYNRGQILYRMAEMMESRRSQFLDELVASGLSTKEAQTEFEASVDRLIYYAGWADKFQQVFSSVNPVSSSHFNFSVLEPTGVVSILAPEESSLLGFISSWAPAVCGGNAVVILASESKPLSSISFSEVLATSDLPAGVINILTGQRKELLSHMSSHMDVNAIVTTNLEEAEMIQVQKNSVANLKRVVPMDLKDWSSSDSESPYWILKTQEVKTTWHPIGL